MLALHTTFCSTVPGRFSSVASTGGGFPSHCLEGDAYNVKKKDAMWNAAIAQHRLSRVSLVDRTAFDRDKPLF